VARAPIVWRLETVAGVIEETPRAKTILLDVPGWPGHSADQHVDVRLTAEDGYQTERSDSIASAPEDARLALTVERIDDGQVSPLSDRGAWCRRRARARSDRRVLHLARPRRRSAVLIALPDSERGTHQGRTGTANEMAGVCAFLASDDGAYITGHTIFVDGGLTLYSDFREPWSSE
jgi:hypothetical protein